MSEYQATNYGICGECKWHTYDMTADITKLVRDANALYDLYNKFGRGVISEEEFCHLYLTDRLADWIVQTYKVERIEE